MHYHEVECYEACDDAKESRDPKACFVEGDVRRAISVFANYSNVLAAFLFFLRTTGVEARTRFSLDCDIAIGHVIFYVIEHGRSSAVSNMEVLRVSLRNWM